MLLSFIVYAILGYFSKSNLIWCFALISLGSWMGAETGYMSGWGAYYLGMNYPLRFILFGGILTFSALALEENKKIQSFYSSNSCNWFIIFIYCNVVIINIWKL
ncbi:hypothetical protein JS55_02550 [Rickettsia felis str. LSU]|nr:hypothetical protein JS55_02550 [Rickettsia felis str. LSU]